MKSVYLYVVLEKDSLTTAGRTGRVELMQAIDLIFTDILRRILCKQYIVQLILVDNYIRNSLIKFRFGVSPIAVHSLQYKTHAYIDIIHVLCVELLSKMKCISRGAVLL